MRILVLKDCSSVCVLAFDLKITLVKNILIYSTIPDGAFPVFFFTCFLQHGGQHSAPARGHRPEEALPGIPLSRRGPQHRRPGLEGARRGGSLQAGGQRRGRHDGHFHQELRRCRGLHRREKGEREDGLRVGSSVQAWQMSDGELCSNIPELHHEVTEVWRSGCLSAR